MPPASCVIFDEAHHYAASEWGAVAEAYKHTLRFGLTATPERGDGRPLGDLFDHVVSVSSVRELQRLGVLVPCVTYAPSSRTKSLSQDPVAAYLARCKGERAFVFCKSVAQAERLTLDFIANGVHAALIHGETPWLLRRARLDAFANQDNAPLLAAGSCEQAPIVLVNAYVLTEGVDVPAASCCILARGCGHAGILLQMAGRVLRTAPGKTHATLIDLCGVVHKLGLPEADRVWSLEGKAITLSQGDRDTPLKACPACSAMVGGWSVDSAGWRICPVCRERVAPPPEEVTVSARELHAMGTAAPPEERVRVLAKLAHAAAAKGFKPGWAAMRYRERFGDWPPRGDAAAAYQRAVRDVGADAVDAALAARAAARAERAAREALAAESQRVELTDAPAEDEDPPSEVASEAWRLRQEAIDEIARCG